MHISHSFTLGGQLADQHERAILDDTGRTWRIRECGKAPVPDASVPPPTCLIADSRDNIRRIWYYPSEWAALPDAELLRLLEERMHALPWGMKLDTGPTD